MATFHPTLPRGARVLAGQKATLAEILVGPAHENDGTLNLFGALRTSMATTGYETVKEFQKAEVMVAPALKTEGQVAPARAGHRHGLMSSEHPDLVLVVDFGAQYAQLIARRVREAHVYSEIVPRSMPVAEMLAKRPKAIILSGGPASVHVDGAPDIDAGDVRRGRARCSASVTARSSSRAISAARSPRPGRASTAAPSCTSKVRRCCWPTSPSTRSCG